MKNASDCAKCLMSLLKRLPAAAPPDFEAASAHYRDAIAIADELEMRPLVAFCHLGLGVLYGRVNKSDDARQHLVAAVAMLREMKMSLWVPRAETELAALDATR